jgi:serine/threonine-protein kinase
LAIWATAPRKAEPPVEPIGAAAPVVPSAAPAPVVAAAAQPPKAEEVDLQVTVSPRQAQLTLDDVELPTNPFEGKVPRDSRLHTLRATASGFLPVVKGIQLERDVIVQLSLQRQSAPATAGTSRTRRSTGRGRGAATDSEAATPAESAPPEQAPDFYEITSKPDKQKPKRPLDPGNPWKE